jgi:hypothetical protein
MHQESPETDTDTLEEEESGTSYLQAHTENRTRDDECAYVGDSESGHNHRSIGYVVNGKQTRPSNVHASHVNTASSSCMDESESEPVVLARNRRSDAHVVEKRTNRDHHHHGQHQSTCADYDSEAVRSPVSGAKNIDTDTDSFNEHDDLSLSHNNRSGKKARPSTHEMHSNSYISRPSLNTQSLHECKAYGTNSGHKYISRPSLNTQSLHECISAVPLDEVIDSTYESAPSGTMSSLARDILQGTCIECSSACEELLRSVGAESDRSVWEEWYAQILTALCARVRAESEGENGADVVMHVLGVVREVRYVCMYACVCTYACL